MDNESDAVFSMECVTDVVSVVDLSQPSFRHSRDLPGEINLISANSGHWSFSKISSRTGGAIHGQERLAIDVTSSLLILLIPITVFLLSSSTFILTECGLRPYAKNSHDVSALTA